MHEFAFEYVQALDVWVLPRATVQALISVRVTSYNGVDHRKWDGYGAEALKYLLEDS